MDRLLTAALIVAPVTYQPEPGHQDAARGWEDPGAGVLHVVGAIAYGLVMLRVALCFHPVAAQAAVLLVGLIGTAGNVVYGFETIHMSLGDVQAADQPGAANLIKPLGLFFPLSLVLVAVALTRLGHRWQGATVLVAALAWPVAHIANIAPIAVAADIALVIALGSLVWADHDEHLIQPDPA